MVLVIVNLKQQKNQLKELKLSLASTISNLLTEKNYMVICDTNIISKLLFRDPEVMKQINIIGLKKVLHINKSISELSIDVIKKDNSLEFPDIFIGATGVYYNLPVYTHNLKHFKLIKGITLYKEQ